MRITQPLMRSGLLLAIASLPLASQASAQGVVQGAAAPTLQGGQARPVQGAPAPAPQTELDLLRQALLDALHGGAPPGAGIGGALTVGG